MPVQLMEKITFRYASQKEYQLSESLKNDPLILQRAMEYLYPIRITNQSKLIFAWYEDVLPAGCNLIDNEKGIYLYECS
jgi:plasmid maintenance system killer protein